MRLSDVVKIGLLTSCISITYAAHVLDLRHHDPATIPLPESNQQALRIAKKMAAQLTVHELKIIKSAVDGVNHLTHTRYQQFYKGIPIFGKQVITHKKNSTQQSLTMNGEYVVNLEQDLANVNLDIEKSSDMLEAMKLELNAQTNVDDWEYSNEKSQKIIYLDQQHKAHLAYLVSFMAESNNARPRRQFFIADAATQSIYKQWNGLAHLQVQAVGRGGNTKIGMYSYGTDYGRLKVEFNNNVCKLDNSQVRTVDLDHHTYSSRNLAYSYNCYPSNDYADDNAVVSNDAYSVEDDAHYFGSVIYNLYHDWFGIRPLSFKLIMRVHYGNHYENAFWDGRTMSFGDGGHSFYPLVALDVAAHEISHGFTEQNSNLIYINEPGSINEAFSDMAGKAAEYYMHGKVHWGVGSDIVKAGKGITCEDGSTDSLRCMDNPERDGESIGNVHEYDDLVNDAYEYGQRIYPRSRFDAEDIAQGIIVHTASGIFNKAFYTLATTPGWDIKKAFSVMVYANQHYWAQAIDYPVAAWGVVESAKDLGYDTDDVINAFSAVGLECNDKECTL